MIGYTYCVVFLYKYIKDKENNMIPKNPVILLSFINMKLRDYYKSIEDLCDDLELHQQELVDTLSGIDYSYDRRLNQFI